jgi:A/G-specific adenine glycosylase
MEFGATQCKPQNPDCTICPLNSSCVALQKKLVKILPVKDKKITIKKRYFNYLVILSSKNKIALKQRTLNDIWKGLYEFPLIETLKEIDIEYLLKTDEYPQIINDEKVVISLYNTNSIVHKLSHQHIYCKFWILNTKQEVANSISLDDLEKQPVPVLIHNFIEKNQSIFI